MWLLSSTSEMPHGLSGGIRTLVVVLPWPSPTLEAPLLQRESVKSSRHDAMAISNASHRARGYGSAPTTPTSVPPFFSLIHLLPRRPPRRDDAYSCDIQCPFFSILSTAWLLASSTPSFMHGFRGHCERAPPPFPTGEDESSRVYPVWIESVCKQR